METLHKSFIFTWIVIFLFLSCSKNEKPAPEPSPEPPALDITVPEITLPDVSSGSNTVTFVTSEAWSLALSDTKAAPGWFDVMPKSGPAGAVTLTISITQANETYDDRSAYIKIKAGAITKNITVMSRPEKPLQV